MNELPDLELEPTQHDEAEIEACLQCLFDRIEEKLDMILARLSRYV